MQNAYERFGSLEFIKRTKETTTRVRVHIDRAVLETPKDERGQASAHLISMIGGDSEIGALWAAATEGALFQIQLPDQPSFAGSVGPEAQCLRGSVMVPGRKRPVRHLVAVSAELAKTKPGADREGALTILVRRRSSVCPLSRCLAISPSSGFGVGILVYARTESTKGDYAVARARLLASSGQGQQANVSQMDWSGPKRAAHSNTGRERINLMEVAKEFLEGVEFAADVRGETSRRERSCRLALAQTRN